MKKIFLLTMLCLTGLWSCQSPISSTEAEGGKLTVTVNNTAKQDKTAVDDTDTVAVKMKMQEHSVELEVRNEDLMKATLSEASVKELESWWDSLPKPIQSQIKANQVEIELTTNVRSSNQQDISPEVTDPQIEHTGAELERIIGTTTDMTFTVNTTLVDDADATASKGSSTNITLVKKVPMKLKAFDFDIYLQDEGISNENMQSLQYWWTRLPQDLKEKIQRREVVVNLTAVAIDKGMDKGVMRLGEQSDDYSLIMADMLQQMIGRYTVDGRSFPLGQINSKAVIENIRTVKPIKDADYVIRLQLQNNKDMLHMPAM
jgi:hypothetical protein